MDMFMHHKHYPVFSYEEIPDCILLIQEFYSAVSKQATDTKMPHWDGTLKVGNEGGDKDRRRSYTEALTKGGNKEIWRPNASWTSQQLK